MAKVMRRVGTSDVDQSGKVRYWTGKSVTPNDTDLTLGATASGVVAIPMDVKILGTHNTGQFLYPVVAFSNYVTPGSTVRYNESPPFSVPRWNGRPWIFRYFVGWRFKITPPAGMQLQSSRAAYTPTTEQRTSRTKIFPPWTGTANRSPIISHIIHASGQPAYADNTELMTFFWSDVDPG